MAACNNSKEISMAASASPAEWKIVVAETTEAETEKKHGPARRVSAIGSTAWKLAKDDPRRVVHGVKVGLSLAAVSFVYYLRPLYDGFGSSALWAVMTVVVVFEYSVGGSMYKGLNRAAATLTGGGLAVGVHWIASKADQHGELVILNGSVFILAAVVTFTRFVPVVKRRFDYGATIFILTFSLVAVSGYRVNELINLAQQRLSTVAIGISICVVVCMVICPVWAGSDLHLLLVRNLDKLADSVEGCVEEYFSGKEAGQKADGYKSVLNSKESEDSLVNLALWEPGHGPFGFRHPWSQYQKIGAAMRSCAHHIEALHASSQSEIQAPELIKKHMSKVCMKMSSKSSKVLREVSSCIKYMQRPSDKLSLLIKEMKEAKEQMNCALKYTLSIQYKENHELGLEMEDDYDNMTTTMMMTRHSLMEFLSFVGFISILRDISIRVEGIEEAVDKLARLADFKATENKL